jgi:hypothetical protein
MLGYLCKHNLFYIGILVSNFWHNMDSKMTLLLIHWFLAKSSHYYSLTNPYLRSYLWLTSLIHFQNAIFYYILVTVKLPSNYNQTYLSDYLCRRKGPLHLIGKHNLIFFGQTNTWNLLKLVQRFKTMTTS